MSQHVLTHPNWIKMESTILKPVHSQDGAYCPQGVEESLPRHGADPSQPCCYQPCTHPSPDCFGGIYSQVSALQGVLVVYLTILTSFCTTTACLDYQ